MKRILAGCEIRQDSQTKMLNANDLHIAGNTHRLSNGLTEKQLASYFSIDSTTELINAICAEEGIESSDVKKAKKGKDGGTWIHPILFVDMAMWYSPAFKVSVLKWVADGLLDVRNDSGDSFKKMNDVLLDCFPIEYEKNKFLYAQIANKIASVCGLGNEKDRWQHATIQQLEKRDLIQNNVILLADCLPNIGTALKKAIEKAQK